MCEYQFIKQDNQLINEDERPIQPSKQVIRDAETASQVEDVIPIKRQPLPKKKSPQVAKQAPVMEEQLVEDMHPPPKYDFEAMIEQALQSNSPQALRKDNNRPKPSKEQLQASDTEEPPVKEKGKKLASKENLKKRQKYDPRKAIEEAKKKEIAKDQNHKSAFPEGFLVNEPEAKKPEVPNLQQQKTLGREQQPSKEEFIEEATGEQQNQGISGKQFLKRKKNKTIIQAKCTWKVESKIDCWVKDRGSTKSQKAPTKSPRIINPVGQEGKLFPGIKKVDIGGGHSPYRYKQDGIPLAHIQLPLGQPASTTFGNQGFQKQYVMNDKPSMIEDNTEMDMIPDENDQQYSDYFGQESEFAQDGRYQPNEYMQQQPYGQQTDIDFTGGDGNPATLQLEELEKVFEMFHMQGGNLPQLGIQRQLGASFRECQIQEDPGVTVIPRMTVNSMFFQCYSDDIYDTILDDLREHYMQLCNE